MQCYLFFFLLLAQFFQSQAKHTIIKNTYSYRKQKITLISSNITKPENDKALYRLIKLENELEVLLIHEQNVKFASASMSVGAGSFADSKEIPGLAHFCEHLLFLGTEKYPKENEYFNFLSTYNGMSNAYTALDETNYFFDINPSGFEGALDRFSQFFIAPLFSRNSFDREAYAVDSENKKNMQSDLWRLHILEQFISNKDSAYNRVGVGSYASLIENTQKKGIDVVKALLEFHSKYYSANLMKLVLISSHSLGELEEFAVKYFSEIPNKKSKKPDYIKEPISDKQLGKKYYYKPVQNLLLLQMVFPVKGLTKLYKTRPQDYLSYLLNHEASGSLGKHLIFLKWIRSIDVEVEYIVANVDFFRINIELTSEGYDHHEDIVALVFQYINMIKEHGVKKWIVDELMAIDQINFRFKEKSNSYDRSSYLSSIMQQSFIDPSDLLSHDIIKEFNESDIENLFSHLNPNNFFMFLVTQNKSGDWDEIEPWYGSKYSVELFSKAFKEKLNSLPLNPAFYFPLQNDFIPEEFIIEQPKDEREDRPYIIHHSDFFRYWHKTDDTYSSPKTFLSCIFQSPNYYYTPLQTLEASLYLSMMYDSIKDTLYYASIVGYSVSISLHPMGYQFSIYGYTDKIFKLLTSIVTAITKFRPLRANFEYYKQQLMITYINNKLDRPFEKLPFKSHYLYEEHTWSDDDLLSALEIITFADINVFYLKHTSRLFIELLTVGSLPMDTINNIIALLGGISTSGFFPLQLSRSRTYLLDNGANYIYEEKLSNPNEQNSAICYSLQLGYVNNPKTVVLHKLLYLISKDAAFDQLRTKEQLGYIVTTAYATTSTMTDFRFYIQSTRDPFYLEQRIVAFLYKLAVIIDNISEDKFKNYIDSIVNTYEFKPTNLKKEGMQYWKIILSGYYDFDKNKNIIEISEILTKNDLKDFFYKYVYPCAKERKKLSIHLLSHTLENYSVQDLPLRKLYYYFKCKRMEITFHKLKMMKNSETKLSSFQKTLIKYLKRKYPKKRVSTAVTEALDFLKKQHIKLRKKAIKDYGATNITDVSAFKAYLKLSRAPFQILSEEKYFRELSETD